MQEIYFTYILLCADHTFYIGKTNNLTKRLRQHNGEIKGGAKYTRSRRPVQVIFSHKHENLSNALKHEIALKKLSRSQKEQLIHEQNKD